MEQILFEQRDGIVNITVNRPQALNALSSALLSALSQALDQIDADTVRCVIVTGAGDRAFVAGADIAEMKDLSPEQARDFAALGSGVFRKLERLPMPVIAAVNGFALGGGCELALACDIRIASENASFAQPEAGLGVIPCFGGTQRLARLVGAARAKELIYTGRRIKARQALEIGLVNAVYPQEQLQGKALELAREIAQNAPFAVRECKRLIDQGLNCDLASGLDLEAPSFAACFKTADMREGMTAFVEKRRPAPFENK